MLELNLKQPLADFDLEVNLQLEALGITALLGPSGSGKTTLLNCIAGFSHPQGQITFNHTPWLDTDNKLAVPPHLRSVGMVFQDTRLFPHLNVNGNIDYAIKRNPQSTLSKTEVCQILDIFPLLHRQTQDLSGGEKQRVAIARALLAKPALLLLDEPFSALDNTARREMIPYIDRLNKTLKLPVILVSHIQEDVVQLANYVVAMERGRVVDQGRISDVIAHAGEIGMVERRDSGALLTATFKQNNPDYQLTTLDLEGFTVHVPGTSPLQTGDEVRLMIKAKDVSLAIHPPHNVSIQNVLRGDIARITATDQSPFAEVVVQIGAQQLHARVTRMAAADLGLTPGQPIFALVKSVSFDR